MESYREGLERKLVELEAQLNEMTGGAGTVTDDPAGLIRSLKEKIADIKSELEEMDDDA